jgi:hypothetical protein
MRLALDQAMNGITTRHLARVRVSVDRERSFRNQIAHRRVAAKSLKRAARAHGHRRIEPLPHDNHMQSQVIEPSNVVIHQEA